jgi:hypothetical protein
MWNPVGLSLQDWSYVAQLVIAGAGFLAVLGAAAQVIVARTHARRERVYTYADRFNHPEIISLTASYSEFWGSKTFVDFKALGAQDRSKLLVVPNLIEEMATTYNRNLIDRDAAAEMLGVLTEALWQESGALVGAARQERHNSWIYAEWEEMQKDTARRRLAGRRKTIRRRARSRLLRGQ